VTDVAIREHPASEVYVTGTFDDWSKSEKLIKTGDTFEKDVTLPSAESKIYYKVRSAMSGFDSKGNGGISKCISIALSRASVAEWLL
jgi:hypothetical protein